MQEKEKTLGGKILGVCSAVICVLLSVILVVNCILIAKSFIQKDKVPSLFGWYPMIVLSDSMYPMIQQGDLILGKETDVSTLKEGDVISFFDPESKTSAVVTHRIVSSVEKDGKLYYTTKGDANSTKDTELVPAENVIGLYRNRIKGLGKAAMFMQTTTGFIVCIAVPVLILVGYDFIARKKREKDEPVDEEKEKLLAELNALKAEKAKRESEAQNTKQPEASSN